MLWRRDNCRNCGVRFRIFPFIARNLPSCLGCDRDGPSDSGDNNEQPAEVIIQEQDANVADEWDEEDDGEMSSLYDFIEVCAPGPSQPGPSRQRLSRRISIVLDDDDDERVEEENTSAGHIIDTDAAVRFRWRRWRESMGRGKGTVGDQGVSFVRNVSIKSQQ